MAKILDKLIPSPQKKLVKLRQKRNWLIIERDTCKEELEAKVNKKLSALEEKFNKKLQKPAFEACDKALYIQSQNLEKLIKYDRKNYLKLRAVNTAAIKKIFKLTKKGESFDSVLDNQKGKLDKLTAKRDSFLQKLETKKTAFLEKNSQSTQENYDAAKAEALKVYETEKQSLNQAMQEKLDKKTAKLNAKITANEEKIKAVKAKITNVHTLTDDVLLSVKGLKMYFGGLKAVDDLTFDVKKGEIFGLIGPNGAGKTTVFNCLTRFYDATGGEMHFKNKLDEVVSLRDFEVHDIILQGISRTFQNVEVVKEVSVLENLLIASTRQYQSTLFGQMLSLPLLKKEEKVMRAKADSVLKYMGLSLYRDRLAWGLPYGVLKRIEIARALMCDPQLIILDEPAAGLNETETNELAELIKKIRTDFDCTILLVEHDMGLVMNVCDHICAISFGRMLAYGTPDEIKASKQVQEAYLGTGGDE